MKRPHRVHRPDPSRRTAWCATCGPTTIRRDHLIGRWRCAKDPLEGRRQRRARREQETLELAEALMRSPRPPF
jgi:hypothetical protein